MNSFIPWVGGKSKLLWIINKMAPDHYSRFIDVFGGSGTVTMSRPIQPGCMEVYNDFNSNLTNLFCCVKNRPLPYVVIDCSSYIANDILSAVALMEADSVLQLASCDLKSVGYLSSQLPLLGELKWDKDKQYRVASNIKPFQAADRIGQVLGSVVFRLPYSQELEEQYLAGELLADLSMKDSRAFRKEINRICEEVF